MAARFHLRVFADSLKFELLRSQNMFHVYLNKLQSDEVPVASCNVFGLANEYSLVSREKLSNTFEFEMENETTQTPDEMELGYQAAETSNETDNSEYDEDANTEDTDPLVKKKKPKKESLLKKITTKLKKKDKKDKSKKVQKEETEENVEEPVTSDKDQSEPEVVKKDKKKKKKKKSSKSIKEAETSKEDDEPANDEEGDKKKKRPKKFILLGYKEDENPETNDPLQDAQSEITDEGESQNIKKKQLPKTKENKKESKRDKKSKKVKGDQSQPLLNEEENVESENENGSESVAKKRDDSEVSESTDDVSQGVKKKRLPQTKENKKESKRDKKSEKVKSDQKQLNEDLLNEEENVEPENDNGSESVAKKRDDSEVSETKSDDQGGKKERLPKTEPPKESPKTDENPIKLVKDADQTPLIPKKATSSESENGNGSESVAKKRDDSEVSETTEDVSQGVKKKQLPKTKPPKKSPKTDENPIKLVKDADQTPLPKKDEKFVSENENQSKSVSKRRDENEKGLTMMPDMTKVNKGTETSSEVHEPVEERGVKKKKRMAFFKPRRHERPVRDDDFREYDDRLEVIPRNRHEPYEQHPICNHRFEITCHGGNNIPAPVNYYQQPAPTITEGDSVYRLVYHTPITRHPVPQNPNVWTGRQIASPPPQAHPSTGNPAFDRLIEVVKDIEEADSRSSYYYR